MHDDKNGFDLEQLAGVLQNEAQPRQADHEYDYCKYTRHYGPWKRQARQFLKCFEIFR